LYTAYIILEIFRLFKWDFAYFTHARYIIIYYFRERKR